MVLRSSTGCSKAGSKRISGASGSPSWVLIVGELATITRQCQDRKLVPSSLFPLASFRGEDLCALSLCHAAATCFHLKRHLATQWVAMFQVAGYGIGCFDRLQLAITMLGKYIQNIVRIPSKCPAVERRYLLLLLFDDTTKACLPSSPGCQVRPSRP